VAGEGRAAWLAGGYGGGVESDDSCVLKRNWEKPKKGKESQDVEKSAEGKSHTISSWIKARRKRKKGE